MKEFIKKLRIYLGLTQYQFAIKINLKSGTAITNYESGLRSPREETISKILKLAQQHGFTLDDIYPREG